MNSHQLQIIRIIDSATSKIQIAVSWFTDEAILQRLIEKMNHLKIEILTSADEMNLLRHYYFRTLINGGVTVKKVGSTDPLEGNFMHSKFVIVDNAFAWGGSYNFTINARSNYETFKKWDSCELEETINEFNNWMSKAVGFFNGIENVDEIIRKLKEKFIQEQHRNNRFLNTINSIDFSEQEYIQKREEEVKSRLTSIPEPNLPFSTIQVKQESLRSTATALSENRYAISSSATVTLGAGTMVKPHSFHGGSAFNKVVQRRRNHFSLICFQKFNIDRNYHCFKTHITNGMLVCTGEIQPTPDCEKYKIRIEYVPGKLPMVYVKAPSIPDSNEIHIYREGFLCLFDPAETNWKDTHKLTEFTIPWTIEWILFYELWKLSGKWEGRASNH